jgi:hypothetical protein
LLSTFVRVCSSKCAPRGVHCICCFFTNALADHLVDRGFNEAHRTSKYSSSGLVCPHSRDLSAVLSTI